VLCDGITAKGARVGRHEKELGSTLEGSPQAVRVVVVGLPDAHAEVLQALRLCRVAYADTDAVCADALEKALDDESPELTVGASDDEHDESSAVESCREDPRSNTLQWEEGTLQCYTQPMVTIKKAARPYLSEPQLALLREILATVAGKWSLWTLHELAEQGAPLRFARLLERVEGISQKMLTQTLRSLERDGLVTRTVFAEVPPRVEYALTPDGKDILALIKPPWKWIASRLANFEKARARFDKASQRRQG